MSDVETLDFDPATDTLSTTSFPYGYSGNRKTELEYLAWTNWQRVDPELARRVMALMKFAASRGKDLGAGGTWRSTEGQEKLFRSRYYASPTGKTYWKAPNGDGPWWNKRAGVAAAAPPGKSFHEASTSAGKCLALDMVGDMVFMGAHLNEFGLYTFQSEPWHVQPRGIPSARASYQLYGPLDVWALPQIENPVVLPLPTLKEGDKNNQVTLLQNVITFWQWDKLSADGWFGPKTKEGVKKMQTALGGLTADGIYGPKTAAKYEQFVLQMRNFDPTQ